MASGQKLSQYNDLCQSCSYEITSLIVLLLIERYTIVLHWLNILLELLLISGSFGQEFKSKSEQKTFFVVQILGAVE